MRHGDSLDVFSDGSLAGLSRDYRGKGINKRLSNDKRLSNERRVQDSHVTSHNATCHHATSRDATRHIGRSREGRRAAIGTHRLEDATPVFRVPVLHPSPLRFYGCGQSFLCLPALARCKTRVRRGRAKGFVRGWVGERERVYHRETGKEETEAKRPN